ncbi:MAG: TauD/TfdA family dioxygenase [Pseudomonadota bacterium]|nr:TauD/TfdA family dioxygenase [Pseudomonadota bacterium]
MAADRLRAAFCKYRLLLICDGDLSAENQARFANIFDDVVIREDYDVNETEEYETQYVSNNRSDGILGKGELDFHHDQPLQEVPLRAPILSAIEIPDSGIETSFAHNARVFDAMPAELRNRLEDKTCLYREDDDQETAVWVNRLTTVRVNEIKVDDLQNLINEVRSYLSNGNIIFPASVEAGRFLHLGEPEASARPRSIR